MDQSMNIELDDKNVMVMKLLHYFITEKNYNPIILQGAENEIWLENMDEDYKIVRIVSNYIHNDEQFSFDIFKTKRIVKKIKKKTFSFSMNTFSFFLDLGDNVNLTSSKDLECIKVRDEKDIEKSDLIKTLFPDLSKKLSYSEEGFQLFMKITNDINEHNKEDAKKVDEVFKIKYPIVTYILIAINTLLFFIPYLTGTYVELINNFCIYPASIRLGEYYRLITGTFLHANIIHLAFNCYALYVIGTQLESYLGKFKYLVVYLFSGLCGALLSMTFLKDSASIGASGAIFGLMGALLYFGYYYRVYLGTALKSQIIPLVLFNLFLGFMLSNVDVAGHIGGLIGGYLITMGVGLKYKSSSFEKVNGIIVSLLYLAFLIAMAFIYSAK